MKRILATTLTTVVFSAAATAGPLVLKPGTGQFIMKPGNNTIANRNAVVGGKAGIGAVRPGANAVVRRGGIVAAGGGN